MNKNYIKWTVQSLGIACAIFFTAISHAANVDVMTIGNTSIVVTNSALQNQMDSLTQNSGVESTTLTVSSAPRSSGPVCGGANQKPCEDKKAKFVSKAKGTCPKGTFFDIGKWECWSCPKGMKRGPAAVDSDRACMKIDSSVKGGYKSAAFEGAWCAKGTFYDPIRDGECWSCPSGYKRSLAHVGAKNACIVMATTAYKNLSKHSKATGLLKTDCPKGQFWNPSNGYCYSNKCPSGYSKDIGQSLTTCFKTISGKKSKATVKGKAECKSGEIKDLAVKGKQNASYGGGCWTCPASYDRTVLSVKGAKACQATPIIKFSEASMKQALTCEKGDVFDLTGLTRSDISSRSLRGQSPIATGTCWTCPDNYARTLSSVKGSKACKAKSMGWYSQPYKHPGLFGLEGANEVLLEVVQNDPEFIRQTIKVVVEAASKDSKKTYNELLTQEKNLFINKPQESTAAAGVVLARMLAAVAKDQKNRTTAEKNLLTAFKAYVKGRKTWIAKDALAAYDAWKEADAYWRNKEGGRPGMATLFDYGTVPPDFQTLAMVNSLSMATGGTVIGIATGSLPLLGDVLNLSISAGTSFASFRGFDAASKWVAKTAVETAVSKAVELAIAKFAKASAAHALKVGHNVVSTAVMGQTALTISRTGASTAARTLSAASGAGPQIIIATALVIGQMALEQVIEIENARPKLLTAVAGAMREINLTRLVKSADGMAEVMGHWSFIITGKAPVSSAFLRPYKTATQDLWPSSKQAKVKLQSSAVTYTAAMTTNNGATYLFADNGTYSRSSKAIKKGFDKGYPKKMPGGWKGLPKSWNKDIDAGIARNNDIPYLWRNREYVRLNGVKVDKGYPKKMPGGWSIPSKWSGNVDAAFYYAPNKKHYLFNGGYYARLNDVKVEKGYPKKLPGGWKGMPAKFSKGIDAATYRNGHVYMIKGDSYIRFTGTKVDRGYPKKVKGNWPQ